MSYVTYILVAGFVSGADGRFTPEVLWSTASTVCQHGVARVSRACALRARERVGRPMCACAWQGMVIVLLEVGIVKLALYLLQSGGGAAALDLAAISGYKFLAAVLVVLVKALLGTTLGYLAIALTGASIGTFMAKTLHQSLLEGTGFSPGFMTEGMGSPGRSKKRKNYSLLGVALLQPLFFWYLSRV